MENIDIIKEDQAMIKSGEVTLHNPLWEKIQAKLENMRIRSNTPLPVMKHLLNINGINCFPRGDLVAISGKEKCGKTTDCRIIVSALMKGEYMGVKALEKNLCVLWIDTEQTCQTSRAVCRGIELMCGFEPSDSRFVYFALREYPDRQEMAEAMRLLFDKYSPDFTIIDGIRDFIIDFNDIVESSDIVLECMRLSSGVNAEQAKKLGLTERPPCCVCCILHQNKPKDDNNMRGHLGTELSNKAGEVWDASQDDGRVFSFTQLRSRTRPVEDPLRYKVFSKDYVDKETGKTEEIGVPELWMSETGAETTEQAGKVRNIKTKHGLYAMNHETACFMFWKVMGFSNWEYKVLKQKFTDYWGIDYYQFNDLLKLTDNHVFKANEKDKNSWRYDGPDYREEI